MRGLYIGITGGIGSGKSEVSAYLKRRGETVICADEVSRQVVMPGEKGNALLRDAFGGEYFNIDGTLNRKKLAELVFSDQESLRRLNGILHPIINEYILSRAAEETGRVFIDLPLLIPSGMHERVDYVWLVVADREERIRRVMTRDHLDREEVEMRIKSQMSDEDMAVYADEVIDNSSGLDHLHRQIGELLRKREYKEV